MAESLGIAVLELRTDGRKFRRGLSQARQQAQKAGAAMTKFLTIPIAALGVVAGRSAARFGDAMNKVIALTSSTREEIEGMVDALLLIGPAVGVAPQELAEALFPIASAGFKGADALSLLTVSAMAAATGIGSTTDVARAAGKIMANYGDEVQTAGEAMGIFVAMVQEADAPTESLSRAMTVFLPKARSLGVDIRIAAAEFAFLTRALGSAETAASSFRQVMAKIQKPPETLIKVLEGTVASFENLQKIAREEGITAAVRTLATVLPVTGRNFQLFFEDVNAADAAMILLRADTEELGEVMRNMAKSGVGSLIKAFNEATKGPMFRFRQATATIQASMIVLGQSILPLVIPVIVKITDVLKRMTNAFAQLDPQLQSNILRIAGLVAIAGPVLLVIAGLMKAFGFLGRVIFVVVKNIVVAIAFMSRAIIANFTRVVLFMFSLPVLFAVAVAAIIAAIAFFPQAMFTFFSGVIQTIARAFIGGFNNFVVVPFQNAINNLIASLPDNFKDAIGIKPIQANELVDTSFAFDMAKVFEQSGKAAGKEWEAFKNKVIETTEKMVGGIKSLLPEGLLDVIFPGGIDQTTLDIQELINKLLEVPTGLQAVANATQPVADAFINMGDQISSSIASATTDAIVNLRSLADFANSVLRIILGAFVQQAIGIPFGNLFGGLFGGGKREHGGPVSQGQSFLVGERGPERFIPNRSGTIIPNNQLGRGQGGGDINLNIQTGLPAQILAELRNLAAEVAADTSIKTIRKAFA